MMCIRLVVGALRLLSLVYGGILAVGVIADTTNTVTHTDDRLSTKAQLPLTDMTTGLRTNSPVKSNVNSQMHQQFKNGKESSAVSIPDISESIMFIDYAKRDANASSMLRAQENEVYHLQHHDEQRRRKLAGCRSVDYFNPADTYTASRIVEYGHYFSGQEDFCRSDDYYDAAMVTPIVILSLMLGMFIFFLIGLTSRECVEYFRCIPDRSDEEEYQQQKMFNYTLFYILSLLVIILDQFVFIGNTKIDTGVNTMESSISTARDTFLKLRSESTTLTSLAGLLTDQYALANQTCNASSVIEALQVKVDRYSEQSGLFAAQVTPVLQQLDDMYDGIDKYANLYRQLMLYFVWALALISVLFLYLSKLLRHHYWMKCSVGLGSFTYTLYVCLGFFWTFSTSMLADLCMKPSYNVVNAATIDNGVQNVAAYFSACVGNSTFQVHREHMLNDITYVNNSVADLLQSPYVYDSTCPGNTDLASLQDTMTSITNTIHGEVDDALLCPPLQSAWFQFLNEGVCDDLYEGVFNIWISQLFTSFVLLLLCITASVTYQYYPRPMKIAPMVFNSGNDSKQSEGGGGRGDTGDVVDQQYSQSGRYVNNTNGEIDMELFQRLGGVTAGGRGYNFPIPSGGLNLGLNSNSNGMFGWLANLGGRTNTGSDRNNATTIAAMSASAGFMLMNNSNRNNNYNDVHNNSSSNNNNAHGLTVEEEEAEDLDRVYAMGSARSDATVTYL